MLALFSVAAACSEEVREPDTDQGVMETRSIEQVLQERTPEWMALRGVVGTGIGECDGVPCIRVMVKRKTRALERKIPPSVGGFRVDIIETGEFQALDKN